MSVSFDTPADPNIAPSDWVTRHAHLVKPGGHVLDVAAGHGRHSRYFLERGCCVTAVDIDTTGLKDLRRSHTVTIVEQDMEAGYWPFAPGAFDAVIVTNYLHRPHFPNLASCLNDAGVLIFETFGAGNEVLGRPRNPDFLLQPGELLSAFSELLQIVAYQHGIELEPRPAVRQRLCAIQKLDPVALNAVEA